MDKHTHYVLAMLKRFFSPELRKAQEFQSALIRIAVWILMMTMIGVAGVNGVYAINWTIYTVLFTVHLIVFLGILLHVAHDPRLNRNRTYLGVLADLSGTSFSIFLSGIAISPFYLLYIWSFVSQGTRYGLRNLLVASVGSLIAFSIVASILDGWTRHPVEISFMLIFLLVLPAYLYSLLNKLHSAKQSAEEASKARGNFLATMTHELRTPLSGVIGMSGLLNGTRLDIEQKEYLESINSSARVLQSLIGDILDLSKIDAGKLELKSQRFDIRHTLVEVGNALSNQALDKGVEVICRVSADMPEQVYGDELRFRQILYNLVGNAVKFTEVGYVLIHAEVKNPDDLMGVRHVMVSVIDTGIGIKKEKLAQIFDSFWQADSSTTRRYGGTGLGTTISRDLTHLMHGVIGVDSHLDKGSQFWVKLPFLKKDMLEVPSAPVVLKDRHVVILEHNHESAQAIKEACEAAAMKVTLVSRIEDLAEFGNAEKRSPVDVMLVSDSCKGMDLTGLTNIIRNMLNCTAPVVYLHYPRRKVTLSEANAASLSKPFSADSLWRSLAGVIKPSAADVKPHFVEPVVEAFEFDGARVLVAEDDNINAKLINSLLTKSGHHVTLVRDGDAALTAAKNGTFDLALIDLRMPKVDGIDFTRAYREYESAEQHLPIIALTANAAEDARAECIEAGMDDFLTKPVPPMILAGLIQQYAS